MRILFVTFEHLSVGAGAIRSISMLRALADAGNQVDVIAARVDEKLHSDIHILMGTEPKTNAKRVIFRAVARAMRSRRYQVVHLVDDALLSLSRLGKQKKMQVVYDAARCLSHPKGTIPFRLWRFFPSYGKRMEQHLLRRTDMILSAGKELSRDLDKLASGLSIVQIDDVPAHALFSCREVDRNVVTEPLGGVTPLLVACSVLPGNAGELRTLLLATRKVIEKVPAAGFFFKGLNVEAAQAMAANLDISNRCIFLPDQESEQFMNALSVADSTLFIAQPGCRYRHAEVLTLLNATALLVAVHDGAYSTLLTETNSLRVDFTARAVAEGLMRVVSEPLLSFGMVSNARQMIADRYSFSSFKHKVRMAYHDLTCSH
jgi:glycosyltransferase involved in cell wall biosynthesis